MSSPGERNLLQTIATLLVAKQRITKQSYGDGKAFMIQVNKALSCPPSAKGGKQG